MITQNSLDVACRDLLAKQHSPAGTNTVLKAFRLLNAQLSGLDVIRPVTRGGLIIAYRVRSESAPETLHRVDMVGTCSLRCDCKREDAPCSHMIAASQFAVLGRRTVLEHTADPYER